MFDRIHMWVIWAWAFLCMQYCWFGLTDNFVIYSDFPFLLELALIVYIFQVCVHLTYLIYWHSIISVRSVVIVPLSFLIQVIFVFSLFLLVSLLTAYQLCWPFQRSHFLSNLKGFFHHSHFVYSHCLLSILCMVAAWPFHLNWIFEKHMIAIISHTLEWEKLRK